MVEDYGEWLKLKRESKGWTQQELAENSGVSQPQVSNIEKGKSLNPQQNTRRALESALGENAPQTVIDEAKIDGLGELLEFQPNESGTWPRCKGIYVLYDADGRPAYVGRSTDQTIADRIRSHREKKWFVDPLVASGAFLEIADDSLCKKLEKLLIRLANPLVNKNHRT